MKVLDLDKFVSEEKKIILGGIEFNFDSIPFIITLQVYEVIPILAKIEESKSLTTEDYQKILSVIYSVLKVSKPDLEMSWVEKHLNLARFNELTPFIFSAIFDDGKKKETDQNEDQEKSI